MITDEQLASILSHAGFELDDRRTGPVSRERVTATVALVDEYRCLRDERQAWKAETFAERYGGSWTGLGPRGYEILRQRAVFKKTLEKIASQGCVGRLLLERPCSTNDPCCVCAAKSTLNEYVEKQLDAVAGITDGDES